METLTELRHDLRCSLAFILDLNRGRATALLRSETPKVVCPLRFSPYLPITYAHPLRRVTVR